MSCHEVVEVGAYVLGASPPDEQSRTERHLGTCATCHDEYVRLAPVVTLLARLDADEARRALEPGRDHSSRRRRVLLAAAAVALVVALGGAVRSALPVGGSGGAATATTTVSAVDPVSGVRAQARLEPLGSGTQVSLHLVGVPAGVQCHLVVRAADGRSQTSPSWPSSYGSTVQVPETTSIAPADIASLDVVTADDSVLVHLQPGSAGG
jgi:anti-sigma factor RsiW